MRSCQTRFLKIWQEGQLPPPPPPSRKEGGGVQQWCIACTHKYLSLPHRDACSWRSSQMLLLCFLKNNPVLLKLTFPLFLWEYIWWHVSFLNLKKGTDVVKGLQFAFIVKETLQHRFFHDCFIFKSVVLTHLYVSGINKW